MQRIQGSHSKGAKDGWPPTLHILAALDVLLAIFGLVMLDRYGWSQFDWDPRDYGPTMMVVELLWTAQAILRATALAVMMRWTRNLAIRATRATEIKLSPLWSWLGFVVPVLSHIQPALTFWKLNARGGTLSWPRRISIATWWPLRLATCPTGFILTILLIHRLGQAAAPDFMKELEIAIRGYAVIFVVGIAARLVESLIVFLTHHQRHGDDDTAAATVF